VHDVTALAERTGVSVATLSQHLSKLRLAGRNHYFSRVN
jgi:DNA-binding transcriptional ArsR family regulator